MKDAMDSIEMVAPGFKEHLMWYEFLTPETYMMFGGEGAPAN